MENKCVLPFINYDYQSNSPCCILKNYNHSLDQQELVDNHKNNIKSKFCKDCWKSEKVGIESKRQRYNNLYKKYLDQTDRKVKLSIIPVGNVCNLNCITCGPSLSTGWIKKHTFMYGKLPTSKIHKDITVSDVENVDQLDHVEFIGGETLQSKSFWKYLEQMNKNISFSCQTNGTVDLSKNQIDLLNTFTKFNICFSIDGVGKIFDYIRQPATWQTVHNNIKKYASYFNKKRLSFFITVSNLNIFYIDSIMINLFKTLPVSQMLNLVHEPDEFSYCNLTPSMGQIVEKNNPAFFKKHNVKWDGTKQSMKKMLENITMQDKFSKRKLSDYLPEVFDLIKKEKI
jgi:sulfatase maturation enzyme AslB (radical SAM superfamily)